VAARLLDYSSHAVQTRLLSSSALSTEVSSSSIGLDMFRNYIQTDGGILSKLGYEHNHKYSRNHSQSVHAAFHTAQDGDLKIY